MGSSAARAVAIVGLGAVMPDAGDARAFWDNIRNKRYSITEVPPERWRPELYYDPDPAAVDKTYSKVGAWVRGFKFDWKQHRIPPKVAAAMDEGQQWAVTIAAQALADYGYPERPLDTDRTGVILGTAIGGEQHYITALRIMSPELMQLLEDGESFRGLPGATRRQLLSEWRRAISRAFPEITEDTMPGELPNIIAGRVANVLNLRGPNFITDAACASSFAAIASAVEMLAEGRCDAVVAGGVDRNMGPSSFVKFCKIGALSATGTRPFGAGADGFVMGEGAGAFLLKRLTDAEAAGDKIYAVIRGVGGSSDGKGKGITAPNPIGQVLAARRAWENAGLDPATATLVEAHGTSTKVGDVTEVESLSQVFGGAGRGAIALGSVKSNIGHLKASAGAAGLLKTVWAVQERMLPPTLNARPANPKLDFAATPFELNHELRAWDAVSGRPRRAGVSAYGFGGTNFHLVLEEHVPGMLTGNGHSVHTGVSLSADQRPDRFARPAGPDDARPAPLQGILALSAADTSALNVKVEETLRRVAGGWAPARVLPSAEDVAGAERIVIDFVDRQELEQRLVKALKAFGLGMPAAWRPLTSQGIFRGSGPRRGKIAFLFPGQGSQTLNMARKIAGVAPSVAAMFAEADAIMQPILGRPLSRYVWVDETEPEAIKRAEEELRQTAITQPAMLTVDAALQRLLAEYGFRPDYVMGHSLGEYAALVASGVMPFAHALEATAARGQEMTRVSVSDPGWMAAVIGPYEVVERTLKEVDGYVVAANLNSHNQTVIGGAAEAVKAAIERFNRAGLKAMRIPVSHAFHTQIVASSARPLRQVLDRLSFSSPQIPVVANVTGELYPSEPERVKDYLERQIASPVQWAKGLETLYGLGVRVFMEVGPKKVLKGFVDNVLNGRPDLVSLFTNHPDFGEIAMFNQAICGLYAAGFAPAAASSSSAVLATVAAPPVGRAEAVSAALNAAAPMTTPTMPAPGVVPATPQLTATPVAATFEDPMASTQSPDPVNTLAQLLAQALQSLPAGTPASGPAARPYDRSDVPLGSVVISGAGLGLPGTRKRFMDLDNVQRILRGEQFIELLPEAARQEMVNKRITRLVKAEDGSGSFETIEETADVVKLAGQPGPFDLSEEFGVPEKLVEALDLASQIAMAAGLDALHEAGIPLVQTYKKTSIGSYLPDRFMLPEALRDETGIIFASAFPGYDRFSNEMKRYYGWESKRSQLAALEDLREYASDDGVVREIDRRIHALRDEMRRDPYTFDRRFLFRVLSMGHSQFAEYIGARGPNTQVNAACASTAQAVGLAEDWIRTGRCRHVLVIAGDATTSENLVDWLAAGFLSVGAAATDDRAEDAALPFDRRRHGMLTGMGSVALVVESEDAVRERGMRAIVEVLATETANSAFHGTRLDVDHISLVMERLLTSAERRFGISRYAIAAQTVFMSHETFTPARGGSAAAEVTALRRCLGGAADEIVVSNTKGLTGHTMAAGVEDVVAVKALEHGIVPPVPNFRDPDPELGALNLSRGGRYSVQYALRLAAGFGSQISMTLSRRIPGGPDRVDDRARYSRWLAEVSGYDRPELEVVQRTLRIKGEGAPQRQPVGSAWQYGTGPTVRAAAPGDIAGAYRPMPLAAVTRAMGAGSSFTKPIAPAAPSAPAVTPAPAAPVVPVQPVVAIPVQAVAPTAVSNLASDPQVSHAATPAAKTEAETPPAAQAPGPQALPAPAPVDPVTPRVLEIVANKTGYPQDMLDLELDLEADLGIDTVKQAETFAAVREAFGIPVQESLSLRDYPTLQSVVGFVYQFRPDLATETTARTESPSITVSPSMVEDAGPHPAPAPSASSAANKGDAVTLKVLEIVADKTGYPQDMLDLELDLEADLGIDTVKQAETFAAVREAFGIPVQESLSLRDYPTLQSVVGFVYQFRPDLATETTGAAEVSESEENASDSGRVSALSASSVAPAAAVGPRYSLDDANRIPRRVPVPALRPTLDLCKPTGATLNSGSRVVVMQDEGGVGKALEARLAKRGVTVLALQAGIPTAELEARLKSWLAEGPVNGVYWLAALDVEPGLERLDLAGWREVNRRRVKNLYAAMRALYDFVAGPGAFLVSATRLGGQHGYGPGGATAPAGGGVSGFTKAYAMEQGVREGAARTGGQGVTVKVVDFGADAPAAKVVSVLVDETLRDPGVIEVGHRGGLRYSVTLQERPAQGRGPGLQLGPQTVFLVTGAAGGITSEIVADLAAASQGVFYLLDLAALPARDDRYVALVRQGRDLLKAALIEEARGRHEKPTPVAIDKQIAGIERGEAALRAVEAVEAAGGRVHYYSLDLRDADACAAVVSDLRSRYGRLDVFIHAGGLLVDRTLPNKEPEQFDLVFDVKADGWFNLMHAAAGLPVGAIVAFSSVAGRFGNNGQTDYSAANDLLCKLTSSLVRTRLGTRGIAIDWTAWGGIGMASRGSVPAIMEALGVDMLSPESGVPTVRRELISGNSAGEVVVAGRLGAWLEERDATGGVDVEKASEFLVSRRQRLPLIDKIVACKLYGGVEIETTLDPKEQPFLYDHAPDPETPWLPGVMATEALAEAAAVLAPDYHVAAVENLQMLGAFKFFRMEPRTLHLTAVVTAGSGDELMARATLRSVTKPAKEGLPPQVKDHFIADVRLQRNAPSIDKVTFEPPAAASLDTGREDIYKLFFHGPAYQVLESAGAKQVEAVGLLPRQLPPDIAHREPNGHVALMAPRLIESIFQAAAFWNVRRKGAMAFPLGLGSVTTYRDPDAANGKRLYTIVSTPDDGQTFDGRVVDDEGDVYVELRGYRTVARPA